MSRRPIDLAGQRFGRLVVIERLFERKGYLSNIWICKCDCGNEVRAAMGNLRNGNTKSCGCLRKDMLVEKSTTHGMRDLPEYGIWAGIKRRCYNTNEEAYNRYGGRGITMSDEWRESFEAFYRDMGPRPSDKHSIERSDNDNGYSKANCYWATDVEQANNRRSNVFYTYNGVTKTLADWCRELNLKYDTIGARLRKGMSFENAIK